VRFDVAGGNLVNGYKPQDKERLRLEVKYDHRVGN